MPIVIKTKKFVDGTTLERQVLEIQALTANELPKDYLNSKPNVYKCRNLGMRTPWNSTSHELRQRKSNVGDGDLILREGEIYTEDGFQTMLTYIQKAGKRLKELNDKKRELEKEWQGEETFVI